VFQDNYSGKAPFLGLGGGVSIGIPVGRDVLQLRVGALWRKALIEEVTATTVANIYNPDAVGSTDILNSPSGEPLKIDHSGLSVYLAIVIPLSGRL
jgi:hypothetical protein